MSETTSQIKLDGIGDAVKPTITRQARQTAEAKRLGIYVPKPKGKPKAKKRKKAKKAEEPKEPVFGRVGANRLVWVSGNQYMHDGTRIGQPHGDEWKLVNACKITGEIK